MSCKPRLNVNSVSTSHHANVTFVVSFQVFFSARTRIPVKINFVGLNRAAGSVIASVEVVVSVENSRTFQPIIDEPCKI